MKVAVLGLGRMGQAVAHRLQEGGHDLTVWNRTQGRAGDLVAAGAIEADSPGEAVAAVDLAISSLANDDAVRALALGAHGLVAQVGSRPYVDASTISPDLSSELAASSPHFVALPILGAPQAVREGQATYLAGGDTEVIDQLQPVLESLGGRLKRFDRPEKASTAKLAVNLLLLSGIAAVAEALAVGRAGELTDDQLVDLLGESPMLAPGMKNRFQGLVEGSGPTWWTTVLAAKDARLATEVAQGRGKELRLASVVHDLYQEAAEKGFDHEDIIAVANLYR
ncbi:MAG TPA: NAD(P)-dependent oxidoreductase [Acidimicrobiales bacterium]|nr:NAD(P)-dependent oxidoreductase [Acidimicrobiales bacterium]